MKRRSGGRSLGLTLRMAFVLALLSACI